MHPSNCPCSMCGIPALKALMYNVWKDISFNNLKSYVIVKNNISSMKSFLLSCGICGGNIWNPKENYGVYEIIGDPNNSPSFHIELCSEACMNMWRLKNATYPIEMVIYTGKQNV